MRYYIGIDLGGTNIAAGLVSEAGELVYSCSHPTRAERPAREVAADMVAAAQECKARARGTVLAMGVGVPGFVDDKTGMVLVAVNLGWKEVPLGRILTDATGLPVHLANDADCAALGEVLYGSASQFDSAVMITLGTGIGGGIISQKHIFDGWTGVGTEPGHIPLIWGGAKCGCGLNGCFESYASATALIRMTREAMEQYPDSALWRVAGTLDQVTAKTSFDAAKLGDETAIALVDRYEEYLAAGLGGITNLMRPQVFIIGGGISNQGETLLAPLRAKLNHYCFASEHIAPPAIVRASLGNDAGIIGAALLGTH